MLSEPELSLVRLSFVADGRDVETLADAGIDQQFRDAAFFDDDQRGAAIVRACR
jgi:hypothetical protein